MDDFGSVHSINKTEFFKIWVACFQVVGLLTQWQNCNYGELQPQWQCIVTSTSYYRWPFFLFFFFVSFLFHFQTSSSSTSVLLLLLLLFFLYSSINFFLPPLTSLPLKNLLHPKHLASRREPIQLRLTEERLDLWPVGLSPSKLCDFFFFFIFSLC